MATAPALTDLDRACASILTDPAAWSRESAYSAADWVAAAEYHFDGDSADLQHMLDRDADGERFEAWQYRGQFAGEREAQRREFFCFDAWRERGL